MEKVPTMAPGDDSADKQNFHEIFEKRLELKRIARELGLDVTKLREEKNTPLGKFFDTHYKSDFDELDKKAQDFKIAGFGGLIEAKVAMKEQKKEYDSRKEKKFNENKAQINYEAIFSEYPELKEILDVENTISTLKDFRMKRMFEILNPKVGVAIKDKNEKILASIKEEINDNRNKLENEDPVSLRQAEFLKYQVGLS